MEFIHKSIRNPLLVCICTVDSDVLIALSLSNYEIWEVSFDTSFIVTYVDEIRPVLACHAEPKVSPESGFLPYHLREEERRGNQSLTL